MKITKFDMFIKHTKEIILFILFCIFSPIHYKILIITWLFSLLPKFINPLSQKCLIEFWKLYDDIEKDIIIDEIMREAKRDRINQLWEDV